ncbi:LysR family transcriptional regulator [Duganella sp. HH101]|uniref:LysR family transcriptional regulator n=1 Tax=Duganella sp. HH101 TaxID=1781066 RepID=UPI000873775E|nr:LysR family transcriptional regulator [Duganella sp. HH101]OFA03415.1 HTH-type transcriptional regulator CynR [Duganella sp. HH101]
MNQPDWDHLRYFLALHDAGTLSGAARAAGVEHTTVARRIDALEAALAVKLFDRFPKGWSLTAAGKALVPHARKMEENLHGLMRAASGSAALSGKVRVSAPPALSAYLLAPHLKAALFRLPGIELDLRGEARETDLMRRESDIALRFNRPGAPGLAVRALTTIAYGLYASPDYLAARAPEQWEFVGYDELMQETPQQQWLEKVRGGRRYCLRSNDLGTLYQAALGGCGVAVLPEYLFDQRRGGLAAIDTPACPVRRKLWIVMHEDVRRAAQVRAVADELIALFTSEGRS